MFFSVFLLFTLILTIISTTSTTTNVIITLVESLSTTTYHDCSSCCSSRSSLDGETGSCLDYALVPNGKFDCSTLTYKKTKGKLAIIRSQQLETSLVTAYTNDGHELWYRFDGSDSANEGVWKYSTGELFSNGATCATFAYCSWQNGQPQGGQSENYMCCAYYGSPKEYKWHDISYPSGAVKATVCLFQHPVVGQFAVTATTQKTSMNLTENIPFSRYEIFPEHVTQLEAFRKCEAEKRYDPSTGEFVDGYLAVIYHRRELDVVKDLANTYSDVWKHSSHTDYGIWLGANVTSYDGTTRLRQEGTRTKQSILLVRTGGTCSDVLDCDVTGTSKQQANTGLVMLKSNSQSYSWLNKDSTVPFVCSFHFSPSTSLFITGGGLTTDLQTLESKVAIFSVRLYSTWRNAAQAAEHCGSTTMTNAAGDVSKGELATMFKSQERSVIHVLVTASKWFGTGNGVSDSDMIGFWTGLSTEKNSQGSWSSKSNLKPKLKWNRDNPQPPYGNQNINGYPISGYTSIGTCQYNINCNVLNIKDDSSNPSSATASYAMYRGGTDTYIAGNSRRRPYLCTYRFPARVNLTTNLMLEYHQLFMTHSQATKFCQDREFGVAGNKVKGYFGSYPTSSGAQSKITKFLSDKSTAGGSGPSWLGPKGNGGNLCKVWHRAAKNFAWKQCENFRLSFACYFNIGTSETQTISLSGNESTMTKSPTIIPERTLSNSTSISGETFSMSKRTPTTSREESFSNVTETISDNTKTLSKSKSLSLTNSSSATFSGETSSQTSSRTKSVFSKSVSETEESISQGSNSIGQSISPESMTQTISDKTKSAGSVSDSAVLISSSISQKTFSVSETFNTWKPYKKPTSLQTLQTVAGTVSLLSGGGAIAAQKNRLDAADKLSRCGEKGQFEDEPDFLSAPMKWKFGNGLHAYARGTTIGNIVAVGIFALGFTIIAAIGGILFKGDYQAGIRALRIPGILLVPVAVLEPPSSEAAAVLLVHDDDGPIPRLLAVGSLMIMVGVACSATIQVARVASAKNVLVLRTLPPSKKGALQTKLEKSHCGRLFVRLCSYLFSSVEGWVPYLEISDYLDVVAGKGNNDNNNDINTSTEIDGIDSNYNNKNKNKSLLLAENSYEHENIQNDPLRKDLTNAESFLLYLGTIIEDFSLPFFALLDLLVSIVLGFCAGVSAGELSRNSCLFFLALATFTAAVHSIYMLYYKPCLVLMTQYFFAGGSVLTTISVTLSFTTWLGREFDYKGAMEWLMFAQGSMGAMMALFSFGFGLIFFLEFIDAAMTGHDLEHLRKHQRENLKLYADAAASNKKSSNHGGDENNKKNDNKNSRKNPKKLDFEEELTILVSQLHPTTDDSSDSVNNNSSNNNEKRRMTKNNNSSSNKTTRTAATPKKKLTDEELLAELLMAPSSPSSSFSSFSSSAASSSSSRLPKPKESSSVTNSPTTKTHFHINIHQQDQQRQQQTYHEAQSPKNNNNQSVIDVDAYEDEDALLDQEVDEILKKI